MKTIAINLIVFVLAFSSCQRKKPCDQYLDKYEQLVDDYVDLVNKLHSDSSNQVLINKLTIKENEIERFDFAHDSANAIFPIDTVRYLNLVKIMKNNYYSGSPFMILIARVDMDSFIRKQANLSDTSKLTKILTLTYKYNLSTSSPYLTQFYNAFRKLEPSEKFATIFSTSFLSGNKNLTDDSVYAMIKSTLKREVNQTISDLKEKLRDSGVKIYKVERVSNLEEESHILIRVPAMNEFKMRDIRKIILNNPIRLFLISEQNENTH